MSFSPDGLQLASGSDDHTIRVWDLRSGNELLCSSQNQAVLSVTWTPDGQYLVSGGADHTVNIWERTPLRTSRNFYGHTDSIQSIAVSPSSQYIASGSSDHTIKLWDFTLYRHLHKTTKLPLTHSLEKHSGIVSSVAFHDDGVVLASGSHDKTVKLWNILNGEELDTLTGHTEAVLSVAFHPHFPLLASGSFDKTVKLWGKQKGSAPTSSNSPYPWGFDYGPANSEARS